MKAKSFIKKNGSKILIGAALFAAGAATMYVCSNYIGFNGYCREDVSVFKSALRKATGKIYICPNANGAKIADLGPVGKELSEMFEHAKPDIPIDAMFIVTRNN